MARKFHDRWFEDYELTLKIPVSINAVTGIDIIMSKAKESLEDSNYSDGRYDFNREMMVHGLGLMIEQAVRESILNFMEQKYGISHVTDHGNGSTSNTAYMKMEEYMQSERPRIYVSPEDWQVQVEKLEKDNANN